jgi:peptidoglycan/LPS O-acetylase OafA/YrhL
MDERLSKLDGVRGLAALSVLIFHYFILELPETAFPNQFVANAGAFLMHGVSLFFVLSGFLIGNILIKNKGSENYFKTFYIRRALRILPLYFALVATYFLIKYAIKIDWPAKLVECRIPDWPFLLLLQNFFYGKTGMLDPGILSVSWSLCVEEQFYLFAPLFIFFVPRNRLGFFLVMIVLGATMFRLIYPGKDDTAILVNLFSRIDSLAIGVGLALLYQYKNLIDTLRQHTRELWFIFFMLGGGLLLLFANFGMGNFRFTWIALFMGSFILLVLANPNARALGWLESGLLKQIGKYSYGIYMLHLPVLILVFWAAGRADTKINNMGDVYVTLISIVATVAVSVLSFHFFEKPLLNIGKKYKY